MPSTLCFCFCCQGCWGRLDFCELETFMCQWNRAFFFLVCWSIYLSWKICFWDWRSVSNYWMSILLLFDIRNQVSVVDLRKVHSAYGLHSPANLPLSSSSLINSFIISQLLCVLWTKRTAVANKTRAATCALLSTESQMYWESCPLCPSSKFHLFDIQPLEIWSALFQTRSVRVQVKFNILTSVLFTLFIQSCSYVPA